MPQAATPLAITTVATPSAPTTNIDVTFMDDNTNGNKTFAIQFVKIGDPSTVILAPSSPYTGTPPSDPTSTPWTISVAFTTGQLPTGVTIANLVSDYQAQVQALATAPNTPSAWGLQIYFQTGITLTILLGSVPVVLGEGLPSVYSLSSPVTVTYDDLSSFVATLPGNLTLPTQWPNGQPITSSLTVQTFQVNSSTKLFDINVIVNLEWVIIPGANGSNILTASQLGIEVLRTNGQPIV